MSSLLSTVKGGSTDQEGVAAAAEGEAPQTEEHVAAAVAPTEGATDLQPEQR